MNRIAKGWVFEIVDDGKGRAVFSAFSKLQIVDINEMKVIKRIEAGKSLTNIALNSNGALVAVKAIPEKVSVYDMESGDKIFSIKLKYNAQVGAGIFFTPDDKYLVSGDCNGNIYMIDWKDDSIELIKKVNEAIGLIQYDGVDEYLFYVNRVGIYRWRYPFSKNQPDFISAEKMNRINKRIEWTFEFNSISYCPQKKLFATEINNDKYKDPPGKLYAGIFNNEFSSLIEKGLYIDSEIIFEYWFFWSKDGDYLAVLNHFAEKENVKIVKYEGLEIIKTVTLQQPFYAHFVDNHRVLVSAMYDGVYAIDI